MVQSITKIDTTKKSSDAQDAHEGIRPTYINITPDSIKDSLSADQYKLYRLIYNRFIASQMSAAVYDTINVDIDVNNYNFKASGQNLKIQRIYDSIRRRKRHQPRR